MSSELLKLIEIEPVAHYEQIHDPFAYEPEKLLTIIEMTPDLFTSGRRNNDLVNWFLARRLVELDDDTGEEARPADEYVDELTQLIDGLTDAQIDSVLKNWDENVFGKLERLVEYYGRHTDPCQLRLLWKSLDYSVPG